MGATNPVPGYDKSLNNNRIPQTAPENPHIQNAPDLSKVNRADRRTDRQDSNLQGDGPIRYDSNFQTFLQRLRAAKKITYSRLDRQVYYQVKEIKRMLRNHLIRSNEEYLQDLIENQRLYAEQRRAAKPNK